VQRKVQQLPVPVPQEKKMQVQANVSTPPPKQAKTPARLKAMEAAPVRTEGDGEKENATAPEEGQSLEQVVDPAWTATTPIKRVGALRRSPIIG